MIDWVVSPVDQRIPVDTFEVRITLSPSQKIKFPVTEIIGMEGNGLTMTSTTADVSEKQSNAEYRTQ